MSELTVWAMRVAIRYFDGFPSWRIAEDRLREVLRDIGAPDLTIEREQVETSERAQDLSFRGSPTVLIDGSDPFLDEIAPVGLSCRLYRSEGATEGAPSLEDLRRVLSNRSRLVTPGSPRRCRRQTQ